MTTEPDRHAVAAAVRDRLGERCPYVDVIALASVDSTNAEVRRLGRLGVVVTADEQTAGRGRLGRSWSTPPGVALAVSVLLPAPPQPQWAPLVTGVAVQRAIVECTGLAADLKWPNDVLLPTDGDRKVAGILCELTPVGVVIGTGINLAQHRDQLPVDTATSLALAGAAVEPTTLLTAYLAHLADGMAQLATDPDPLRTAYLAVCRTVGSTVALTLPDGQTQRGQAVDVDSAGRLVVDHDGDRRAVAAADVMHVRPVVSAR